MDKMKRMVLVVVLGGSRCGRRCIYMLVVDNFGLLPTAVKNSIVLSGASEFVYNQTHNLMSLKHAFHYHLSLRYQHLTC